MTLHHPIRRAFLVAAGYLLTAVLLNTLRQGGIVSAETAMRVMGILIGSTVLLSANVLPKKLVPLARVSCNPGREQTLRRFAAWTLVLGGLGFALAYAFAPIAIASTLAICLMAPAVIVVAGKLAHCLWMSRSVERSRT
ncbi:hypothetical protein [Massilia phyllosphaerae]|uniref:hypothetical protein n=1 Tax=Massilia phyllosphaerae TaxID=3106034 RepID=UPI002B1CAB7D|nr:hypothetical protein [Massilia sp. SGZ-792]